MRNYFNELSGKLFALLKSEEVLLLNFTAEDSDFVRLNQSQIRQAGNVHQQNLQLTLISGAKQTRALVQLMGDLQTDYDLSKLYLYQLRDQMPFLVDDPYLNYSVDIQNTTYIGNRQLPDPGQAIDEIISSAASTDLVGIWASGAMCSGFANSLGQFNWHCDYNFNFDWSVYLQDDKAVKLSYAGRQWDVAVLKKKMDHARETLSLLRKPAKTIQPGEYRVFLTPGAMYEIAGLLGWGGFGLKSHRTSQTPLIKMVNDDVVLNGKVNFIENHADGLTPRFTKSGFIKPDVVTLIENGKYKTCLSGARSAKEYGSVVNAAFEQPQSLHINAGTLKQDNILNALGDGIYISNLWYSNYSDRAHCRITGMTRFATLWVENGVAVAPLSVMRFDDSIYNMLGEGLVDFTQEREHIFDASSYEKRSDASALLPGVLIDGFRLTL